MSKELTKEESTFITELKRHELVYKNPSELIPYGANAKRHSREQISKIATSIREFGFWQPVVVDVKGEIVVGHARAEAAKLIGLKEVTCFIASDLTEEQIKAYRLIDNKLNESVWEKGLVRTELPQLSPVFQDLLDFKFKEEEASYAQIPFSAELLESNNYVLFYFNNEIDWLNASQGLELVTVQPLFSKEGYRRAGIGRVLDGKRLLELLNSKA